MGIGQNLLILITSKRQKPITPVFSIEKAQGLMFLDYLRPTDSGENKGEAGRCQWVLKRILKYF